jgi:hypothetical protein
MIALGPMLLATMLVASPFDAPPLAAGAGAEAGPVCRADPEPPTYYDFPLVSTRRVPGTGPATGVGRVTFATSPFGVALAADGSYLLDVWLSFERLRRPPDGELVVWFTTPTLDRVERAGTLDETLRFAGQVRWNKFLVVVTLETDPDPSAEVWRGPVVIRGMSRSGMMHTMAGHGPFEKENCASFGY